MPRFLPFRRKSTATTEDVNPEVTISTFQVLERHEVPAKSFDGGAKFTRLSQGLPPKAAALPDPDDDNMFAGLKDVNRDSGASSLTKTTLTDTSSRHSNLSTSTAPSSADLSHEEAKNQQRKPYADVPPPPPVPKSSAVGFLRNAGRTFSFGQKKPSIPSPTASTGMFNEQEIAHGEPSTIPRARAMTSSTTTTTGSTTSTATPPKLDAGLDLDLDADFGNMFVGFEKRSSVMAIRNGMSEQQQQPPPSNSVRSAHPAPLNIDKTTKVEPSPHSWNSQNSNDNLLTSPRPMNSIDDHPPTVPRHGSPQLAKPQPSDNVEDDDAAILQESLVATKWLGQDKGATTQDYQMVDLSFTKREWKKGDDNLFSGSSTPSARTVQRYSNRNEASSSPQQPKVMTPAQFERYRMDKERHVTPRSLGQAHNINNVNDDDDEEEEDNYEDDEDELEKSRQTTKQRRKQEAHMTVYRQQMMKVTGEAPIPRPAFPTSISAPNLNIKGPSPEPNGVSDSDEDEEIPLAILQAHGFPNRNRPPTHLGLPLGQGSRASTIIGQNLGGVAPRPSSGMGDRQSTQRHSTLPAFARNLPQDPFVGASLVAPPSRESLAFGGGAPAMSPQPSGIQPGGLVGVIINEERSRALRRGNPNVNLQHGSPLLGHDPSLSAAQQQFSQQFPQQFPQQLGQQLPQQPGLYGMNPMASMSQASLSAGEQAQLQMSQQMQQFLQMQMKFMEMMASQQGGAAGAQQSSMLTAAPQIPQVPGHVPMMRRSASDLSLSHSMARDSMLEPPRFQQQMRTMSMVQPGYAGSIHSHQAYGYTPSIAPSERSNIGLPGRYRPVSQVPGGMLDQTKRLSTMSGAINAWEGPQKQHTRSNSKLSIGTTVNKSVNANVSDDEDEEEGWEAMKANMDKKKSMWKIKKTDGNAVSTYL